MNIEEIIGLIPADKQEAVKSELANYAKVDGVQVIKIANREDAERLAREHPHLKGTVDSFISKAVASHDERFTTEKLPSLVEAEIMKRNPPKDPRDLKLHEMEQKLKEMEMTGLREKQTALAVAVAAEKGLPIDIAKKYIGNNDAETIANLEQLSGALMPWKEESVKRSIAERLGNNGVPKAGANPSTIENMKRKYIELNNSGRSQEATALWLQIQQEERKLNG